MPGHSAQAFVTVCLVFPECRAQEVPVCHLLPVWPDPGYPGVSELEDEGPGLCHLQRCQQQHQRPAFHAEFPLLSEAQEHPVRKDRLRHHCQDKGHRCGEGLQTREEEAQESGDIPATRKAVQGGAAAPVVGAVQPVQECHGRLRHPGSCTTCQANLPACHHLA